MRNITSTIRMTARECRRRGQGAWPIPLEKLDALAEYLKRVDQLVLSVEAFSACVGATDPGQPWSDDDVEGLAILRGALDEVRS